MPNWCNNSITITHKDPAVLEALAASVREGKFCNHIIPVPESLHITAGREGSDDDPKQIALKEAETRNIAEHGYANWYDFCVAKWGTKWDVDAYEGDDIKVEDGKLSFGFDSAWSPPTGIYEAMAEQGYYVKAFYWESGMAFCGVWEGDKENGFFDDYQEIGGMTSKEVAESIDPELDEVMGISETIANYEEEEENENES